MERQSREGDTQRLSIPDPWSSLPVYSARVITGVAVAGRQAEVGKVVLVERNELSKKRR